MRSLLIMIVAGTFLAGCADEPTCGTTKAPDTYDAPLTSGEFELSRVVSGEFREGAATQASLEVDREAEVVTLTYQLENGSTVVETYAMKVPEPQQPGPGIELP